MSANPSAEHKAQAPTRSRFGILTVSDSRTPETDGGGDECARIVVAAGHAVSKRALVKDEAPAIRAAVEAMLRDPEVEVVLATGGTGIAPRDVTPEAVAPLFEKTLPGFGEAFRMLSFQEIGSAAMLSRATAGIAMGKPIFLLPGSPKACLLAVERLIVPETGHILGLLRRS